jgi:transcription termination factor Rho
MSILDRAALQASPLADLHTIASELSIDGYRRLRKAQLIDAIIARQEGTEASEPDEATAEPAPHQAADEPSDQAADEGAPDHAAEESVPVEAAEAEELVDVEELAEAVADELAGRDGESGGRRRRRGRRGGRGRGARDEDREEERDGDGEEAAGAEAQDDDEESRGVPAEEETVDGIVELVGNGSGFVRANPPEPSDDDVYVSAAQVKRCELLSGDRITGPRRPPRRSERFASMVRIDTINGRPAAEAADSNRFDDLPAAFAHEPLTLGTDDPTITAIKGLAPIGKGSRVTITGGARAGKTEALRRLADALAGDDDLHVLLVLTGVRPEEVPEWEAGPLAPAGALNFAASADAQSQLVEPVVDQARRWAVRGAHAVILIDTLDGLHPQAARKVLASARKIVDGGSLTVIATSSAPLGGETTVIALDALLAAAGRFPALDVGASATIRPELLVGEDGAETIARMRTQALER